MKDLVEKMLESDNEVIAAAAKDVSKWSKLKHNKQDLEFFLKNNLVHLKFKPKNNATFTEIVCTSNTRFIALFSATKTSQKKKALRQKLDGIKTKENNSVLTYNLIDCKYNTVYLDCWEIACFLTITEDNIEILDKVANKLLKKIVEDDLSNKK